MLHSCKFAFLREACMRRRPVSVLPRPEQQCHVPPLPSCSGASCLPPTLLLPRRAEEPQTLTREAQIPPFLRSHPQHSFQTRPITLVSPRLSSSRPGKGKRIGAAHMLLIPDQSASQTFVSKAQFLSLSREPFLQRGGGGQEGEQERKLQEKGITQEFPGSGR